jgi:hypothetical protein
MEFENIGNRKVPDWAWWLLVLLFPIPWSPWWLCIIFIGIFCFLVFGVLHYEKDSKSHYHSLAVRG